MRICFMGTPEFAVPSLEALAQHHEVVLVVTRPDAVRSRGKKLVASPVKECALKLGLPLLETRRMDEASIQAVADTNPDLIVVAAYGCILPEAILTMAPYGCINVHASLLPAWRGAAPIQRAIMSGDEHIGVSIMKVVQALDAGDYCAQASIEVSDEPCEVLMDRLAHVGADELISAIQKIEDGSVEWTQQDESKVTLAPKVLKDEMKLTPEMSASVAARLVQSSMDAAPAKAKAANRAARILCLETSDVKLNPGELAIIDGWPYMGFADGACKLTEVKPDGKREMDGHAFAAGIQDLSVGWSKL